MPFQNLISRAISFTSTLIVLSVVICPVANATNAEECRKENPEACLYAGSEESNPEKAFRLHQKGCEFGVKNCCWLASDYAEKHVGREEYARLIAAGCKLGHDVSCEWDKKINKFDESSKQCLQNPTGDSCISAGQGALPDRTAALKFYEKGCAVQDGVSCLSAGDVLAELGKNDQALKYWRKACNFKKENGCERIADQERERVSRLCDSKKNIKSCFTSAEKLRIQGEEETALPLYKKACKFEHGASCISAGRIELNKGELDAASESFLSGCSNGNRIGCDMNQQVQTKILIRSQENGQAAMLRETQEANRHREETEAQAADEQRRARALEMMSRGMQQISDSARQPAQQKQTDYQCVSACTAKGFQYNLCLNKCSY